MKAPETKFYRGNSFCVARPDREWLEYQHFVLGKPYKLIAAEIGAHKDSVTRWARLLKASVWNVVSRNGIHPPLKVGEENGARFYGITREWLVDEYIRKDKSAKQIAGDVGTSAHAVIQWLRKNDVPIRDRKARNQRHSKRMTGSSNPAWNGGTSRNYHVTVVENRSRVCEWCRTTEHIQVHHRNHDTSDGSPDNLGLLCRTRNQLEAYLWALEQSKRAKVSVDITNRKITIKFQN